MRCNVEELQMLISCFGSLDMEAKSRKIQDKTLQNFRDPPISTFRAKWVSKVYRKLNSAGVALFFALLSPA